MKSMITDSLEEDAAFRRTGSWASRGLAQAMVFLNGLALTIVAFVTVSMFIDGLVNEDREKLRENMKSDISRGIAEYGASVRIITSFLEQTADLPAQQKKQGLSDILALIQNLEFPYWIYSTDQEWKAVPLFSGKKNPQESLLTSGFVGHLLALAKKNPDSVSIDSAFPGNVYRQESEDPLVLQRPFLVMQPILRGRMVIGIVVGTAQIGDILEDTLQNDNKTLSRLTVIDAESGQRLYHMDKSAGPRDPLEMSSEQMFTTNAGNKKWNIVIEAGYSPSEQFLKAIPFLMLAFGLTLTLIGTLYVRNNQKKSAKLALANRDLAQKNLEYNNQILERERLYHALRKAERENRAIIDSVSDVIFETNTEGEILFLNETWRKVTGFEIEQSMGRNLFDLIHPQDQEEQKRDFVLVVKGQKQAYRVFTRIRTSDGTFRSVELAVSMLRVDEAKNLRVVGTFTDVEERRRAEKALSEAEKKYRTIVENAAGGIYQLTPEGQYLSANPAMARILGYESPEALLREVKNTDDQVYVDPRSRAQFVKTLEAEGSVRSHDAQVWHKSGKKIWISENARIVRDEDGNTLYFEGSVEDITQRKEAEISLRETKIQSDLANRAKSEFLANMSHELRTPLNAIIGFSEIIKNEAFGPIEQRAYWEYARDIHSSGSRLLKIINEILDVSRIEVGERQLNEEIVDLREVADICLDLLHTRIEANSMVVSNLLTDATDRIIGEKLAIKQILMNLLSNAIKFTPSGGRITVSSEIDTSGELRLSVTDTGIGLDEGEIKKALSPFGQVDSRLSKSGSGTGLGLTLVDSLIRLHGGRLELFSQKGIGTTVTVIVPKKRVKPAKAPQKPE